LQKRFNGGGTLLAAYTWAKLLSNTDTITSWLETGGAEEFRTGTICAARVNFFAERSTAPHRQLCAGPSAGQEQEIPQRSAGSWRQDCQRLGIDGVTTLQTGFPVNINAGGNGANYYGGGLRPMSSPAARRQPAEARNLA